MKDKQLDNIRGFKKEIWNNPFNLSTSLITLNQLNIEKSIDELLENDVNMLHLDILDGQFSPEMPLGFRMIEDIKNLYGNSIFYDAHVMVNNPEFYVDKLIDIGVDHICFHYETAPHVDGLLNKIHNYGIRGGVALKPATPLTQLEYVLEKCDSVLVMMFNPGYSWSSAEQQIEYTKRKVVDLKEMINKKGLNTKIIIDGRINIQNVLDWALDIVDIFVAGSTLINREHISECLRYINKSVRGKNVANKTNMLKEND